MSHRLSLEILSRLIAFDTTSKHSNLALLSYIEQYLEQHDIACQYVYSEDQNKANLYATIGDATQAGIMLSGHTDTVPVDGQDWHFPPYQLTEKNGYYYGRGTTDMKGFIAVVLAAVPQMVQTSLKTPIHLAFSYDEEIGCIGVRRLIETLQNHPVKPAICIIGEPTTMQVVTAHKGKLAAKVTVKGKECHSGMAPFGVNAVNYAARLVHWLEQLAQHKQQNGPFEQGYEIPYSTVHTGTIHGGTALNIVPNHCEFVFEIRNIAQENPHHLLTKFQAYIDELIQEMQQVDISCDINLTITTEYPALSTATESDVVSLVRQLAQEEQPNTHINFGTEGGLFSNRLAIPTVVCGPGNMEQGHKPDEFIHIDQIEQCEAFMQRLIRYCSEH